MSYLAYEIVEESFSVTRDGPTAQVAVICPWNEADIFALACVGGYQTYGGAMQYFTPTAYANNALLIFCNKADVKPLGTYDADGGGWADAKVTLSFGKLDQPEDEGEGQDPTQIADFTYDITAQEMTLPKSSLQYFDGESNVDMGEDDFPNPIKMVAEGSATASFKFRPRQTPAQWIPYVGKVNQAEFRGFPAESVLFAGVSTKRTRTTDGKDAWEYACNFLIKYDTTWNKVWRPEDAEWKVLHPKQYELADFDDLINNL